MIPSVVTETEFAAHQIDLARWHRATLLQCFASRNGQVGMLWRDHDRQAYFWTVLKDHGDGFALIRQDGGYAYRHCAIEALLGALDDSEQ